MSTLPAIIGLQYQAAKALGRVGLSPFDRWGTRADAATKREAIVAPEHQIFRRLPGAEEAVAGIRHALDAPRDADERLPEEVRARSRRSAHVQATIASMAIMDLVAAHAAAGNVESVKRFAALLSHLPRVAATPEFEERATRIKERARGGRRNEADREELLREWLAFDDGDAVMQLSGSTVKETVVIDGCDTTTVTVTGSGPTGSTIASLAQLVDPAAWATNLGVTFRQAYPTQSPDVPVVTGPPVFLPGHTLGSTLVGPFFEDVALAILPGVAPTEFRNILKIAFNVGATVDFEYALYECLTSRVFAIETQGGIDVDSGELKISISNGTLTMVASKALRFTAEAPFGDSLNLLMVPVLIAWMRAVVVAGLNA